MSAEPLIYDSPTPFKLSSTVMSELYRAKCVGLSDFVVSIQHLPSQFNKVRFLAPARLKIVAYFGFQKKVMVETTTLPDVAFHPLAFHAQCDTITLEAASTVDVTDTDATFQNGLIQFSVRGWP
jgi:hypothetical protein